VKGDAHFPEFEDRFRLNQVIHENRDFRVERWHNLDHPGPVPGLETWPLPEA
jgi:hypothetical protein